MQNPQDAKESKSRTYQYPKAFTKWIFREIRRIYMADEIIYVMS